LVVRSRGLAKHLSHLAPVTSEIVTQIRTGDDLTPFQTTMSFLNLDIRLPGAPISLGVFKKQCQIRSGGGSIVFDEHHHVASDSLH
jgi:hypothetical protein